MMNSRKNGEMQGKRNQCKRDGIYFCSRIKLNETVIKLSKLAINFALTETRILAHKRYFHFTKLVFGLTGDISKRRMKKYRLTTTQMSEFSDEFISGFSFSLNQLNAKVYFVTRSYYL